jgi:hypothetical protein
MGKPGGLGIFTARRKSAGNAVESVETQAAPEAAPATHSGGSGGGFRVMTQTDVQRIKHEAEKKKAMEKSSSKFPRFSGFGGAKDKTRNQSVDDDSPSSSKRYDFNADSDGTTLTKIHISDSKSSSGTGGTQFSSSGRYYNGQHGSTSTLPSSADTDPNDSSMFSGLPPRPPIQQYGSSPSSFSMGGMKKQLPLIPPQTKSASSHDMYGDPTSTNQGYGRSRALTTSSYASTAIPPKLDTGLDFGGGFDDMFTGLDRKPSPDFNKAPAGRSLLADKRAFQAEPITIDRKLDIEPPLQSWDSRGSDDNLMSPRSEKGYSPPPPPVPAHKYASKYAPVASDSPELNGEEFEDRDARLVRQSFMAQKPIHKNPSPREPSSLATSSSTSLQTPLPSSFASSSTTPKTASHTAPSYTAGDDNDEDDNMFAPAKPNEVSAQRSMAPVVKAHVPTGVPKRMTEAEFRAYQNNHRSQTSDDSSEEEDDYEDEDELIERRHKEEAARRQQQQLQIARIHMQRAVTTPGSSQPAQSSGFPSEVSMQADQWDDEDVPLGVLAAHGFPGAGRPPTQPPNAAPSYFRTTPAGLPDRPSSAGPMGAHAANGYRPPFARGLPEDPYSSVIGGGLVRPMNRESMGFNRGPSSAYGGGSVYGEPTMPYHEPNTQPSLVERIHMSEMSKPKYTGGASSKNPLLAGGPFTGGLGAQMGLGQSSNPTRMSQMPMLGMNGAPMMGMMGNQMPMMGMNQMGYPQTPEQMQQAMMQMQHQMQMQMQHQQMQMQQMYGQPQDPRMSMAQPNLGFQAPNFGNGSFMNVPNGAQNQRPMSIMSQQRPYSTPVQYPQQNFGAPQQGGYQMGLQPPANNGYTPSIAPSERSNIGLSARYRPVATGNQDAVSNVSSSMTLQASGGAAQATPKVKGILKNKSPQVTVREDDEDWGRMAARKSKFAAKSRNENGIAQDYAHAVDSF